jgi:hypothetical protein
VAQFGVIFILFALGLEFSMAKVGLFSDFFSISFFYYVYVVLNFDYPIFFLCACSFELFDLLLFLEAYCKFFYLCACVVLLYRYVFIILIHTTSEILFVIFLISFHD